MKDQILKREFRALRWDLQIPRCPETTAALSRMPQRTQCIINRMRTRCPTHSMMVKKDFRCAYCGQDIACQHTHDLVECPRTTQLRGKLLDHLPDEDHTSDREQLAINILQSQTRRCYRELQDYQQYQPPPDQ